MVSESWFRETESFADIGHGVSNRVVEIGGCQRASNLNGFATPRHFENSMLALTQ
jgi:hypothetical protein